jgi:hypothetical protein
MESTGVYWIPLFELLESRGFTVYLVPDRKPRFFEKSAHNLGFGLCIFRWTGRPIALAGRPARNGPCRGRFSGAAVPARLAGDATLSVAQAAFW